MTIDFHIHAFPDKLAPRAVEELSKRAKIPAYTNGTLADTIQKMRESGIDKAVMQSIATNAKQTQNVNNFAISANSLDEIVAFGSIHPESDYRSELDRLKDSGIKGIKLHPDYQGFFIDDKKMLPIYEYILKKGFVLLFHAGLDYGLPEPVHATPERIGNVMGVFSGEKVCFAHMGGFSMHEEAKKYIYGKDVYIDTSCVGEFVGGEVLAQLVSLHRRDRVLFATDSPWNRFGKAKEMILSMDIDDEFKELILHKNAEKLLGIKTET